MIDQGNVFASHAERDRTLYTLEGNTAVVPASRQSLVGEREGTGDTTVAQKDSPHGGDVRLRIAGFGWRHSALVGPEAVLDLDGIRRGEPADPGAHQLLSGQCNFPFVLLEVGSGGGEV